LHGVPLFVFGCKDTKSFWNAIQKVVNLSKFLDFVPQIMGREKGSSVTCLDEGSTPSSSTRQRGSNGEPLCHFLAIWKKMCIFAADFEREITKRYARLLLET